MKEQGRRSSSRQQFKPEARDREIKPKKKSLKDITAERVELLNEKMHAARYKVISESHKKEEDEVYRMTFGPY